MEAAFRPLGDKNLGRGVVTEASRSIVVRVVTVLSW
jgi:hypothetical protein